MKKLGLGATALVLIVLLVWAARAAESGESAPQRPQAVEQMESAATLSAGAPEARDLPEPTVSAPAWLKGLAVTSDPNQYAVAVAAVVFGLDTTAADPNDYRALLIAEADPQMSPRGRADLERMVAERIPAPELWERMRANEQWSQWQADDVWQPGAWDEVVTSGQAEPGWAVRNVLGQQTTHFRDGGSMRSTSRERTITIGMRCPAPGALVDRCRLTLVGIGVVS